MELGEVSLTMPYRSAANRMAFSLGLGAWMTGVMYAVARVPWAGVFALGVALGWVLLDYWLVLDEERERREDVIELEKQVVALRASMSRMVQSDARLEAELRRAAFRASRHARSEPAIERMRS